ncbi:MAG: hypothetical protein AB7H48_09235 [Parachlamydiales bacterium]
MRQLNPQNDTVRTFKPMRKGNLLFSAVQFIFVVALFLLGGLFIGLHYTPHLRMSIANLIMDQAVNLSFLGYVTIVCALLLCIGFYVMHRGAYFRIRMDGGDVIVEPKLIEGLVQDYWKERFPENELKTEVILRGYEQIEVVAEMPQTELTAREVLLPEIEKELGALLSAHLGYRREWMMTLIIK